MLKKTKKMNNKEFINKVKPLIFEKKLNNKTKFILLDNKQNTLAPTKYFPPATQEWYNSLYAYNNLYTKNITIADKNFSRLIKSYFNLYFSKYILSGKRVLAKVKRASIKKIFISKADVKHTASKVVITLYVYNEERRTLLNRLRSLETVLFPSIKFTSIKNKESKKLSLQDKINIINKEENLSLNNSLLVIVNKLQDEIRYNKDVLETIKQSEVKVEKLLEIKDLDRKLKNILTIAKFSENDSTYNKNYTYIYDKFINKIILEKEIINLAYYKLLLSLNKYKFEDKLLLKLKPLISKIYGKNVEFNIINLKAIYLNSDIFTQVISLKLTNRDNPLLRVLKRFLRLAKLPKFNLLSERYAYTNIKELWINKVKNLTLNYLGPNTKKDNINQLLIGLFNDSNFSKRSPLLKSYINENKTSYSLNLINYVLESLKHKNMAGVRLEAKGRLTRRLTASRSVLKIKWKGSLKNIYSTYRGLPSVMLRGHAKSNVSYSIANSKTRNGAFGLKGWISGK